MPEVGLWVCFKNGLLWRQIAWLGFPFLAASVYGGSIPGHVLGMAIAGMVLGSLPVLGMILRCCLAFGDSFVAGVGDHSFALLRGLIGF